MNDLILEAKGKLNTVKIYCDESAESPRDWDNLGIITAKPRNYNFNEGVEYGSAEEFKATHGDKHYLMLPIYLYDHSGICLQTTPFSCNWDSGQLGWIWASLDSIRKCYDVKRVTKKIKALAYKSLNDEIELLNQYVQGNCYGYVVTDCLGAEIDSCWGFIGDIKNNGLLDNLDLDLELAVRELI